MWDETSPLSWVGEKAGVTRADAGKTQWALLIQGPTGQTQEHLVPRPGDLNRPGGSQRASGANLL